MKQDERAAEPFLKPHRQKHIATSLVIGLVLFSSYFFTVIEKTPTVQQQLTSTRPSLSPAALRLKYEKCKRLLWFMCLNDVTTNGDSDYNTYLKAALLSAQKNAPSLIPYLIVDGAPSEMTEWFQNHGKRIHWSLYKINVFSFNRSIVK